MFLLMWNMVVLIWAIAGMGLMVLVGQTGQASLGHAAFLAVGCYANVLLQEKLGFPFILSFPLAGVIAGLAGVLLALPTTRLHGIYLAIATLAISILADDIIVLAEPLTNGVIGLFAPTIDIFGLKFDRYANPDGFYWLVLAVAVAVVLVYRNLLRSPLGRSFAAVRDSEVSAQAMGVNVARTKAISFGISTAITGLAGALFADLNRFVSPTMFSWQLSGEFIVFIIIGGTARLFGPVVGACLFVVLEHYIGGWSDYWHIWFGLLLLVIVLFGRGGVIGLIAGKARAHG